jgi:hypothetical protein
LGQVLYPPDCMISVEERLRATQIKLIPPYRDKSGFGFFVPIYPQFQTNRGKVGGRLGIHPDGNKPGTLGCIGITDSNTKNFHNAIKMSSPSSKLILLVK